MGVSWACITCPIRASQACFTRKQALLAMRRCLVHFACRERVRAIARWRRAAQIARMMYLARCAHAALLARKRTNALHR